MNEKTNFLIVDDYENIRSIVKRQLNAFGFNLVVEAENVADAQKIVESGQKVDFIISDWNMPGATGLDFLKWIRKEKQLTNLPFLILTTEKEQAKVMSAISEGVSNFLLKPWEEDDLADKLELCWKKHNG
jgi:two-component system chemotaxis response regulator CheY